MKLNELVFDTDYCDSSPNLNLVDEFVENNNELTTTGRVYKGAGGRHGQRYPHLFGLRESSLKELVHEDENYLVGYEPDCERCKTHFREYKIGKTFYEQDCGRHNCETN